MRSTYRYTQFRTHSYDPFGRLLYADPPPACELAPQFMFSTKQYESHWQHYYYGYRYYSPDYGRWLSRDPIGEADAVCVYLFSYNKLTMSVDVLGMKTLNVFAAGGGKARIVWDEYECNPSIEWVRKPHFGTGAAHELVARIFGGMVGVRIKEVTPILVMTTGKASASSYSRTEYYYVRVYSKAGYTATFQFRPLELGMNLAGGVGVVTLARKAAVSVGMKAIGTGLIIGAAKAVDEQLKGIGARTWTHTDTIEGRGYIKCKCKKE